jgi:hypothetical protein
MTRAQTSNGHLRRNANASPMKNGSTRASGCCPGTASPRKSLTCKARMVVRTVTKREWAIQDLNL